MKARFVFLTDDEKNGKVKLYFQNEENSDVLEIAWSNADYIQNKLDTFGVGNVDGLTKYLNENPEQEVYKYEYKDKDGKKHEGFTLDEPFPTATDPSTAAIVSGKVVQVRNNGLKVAIIVQTKKDETFTVVRSYYVFDKANKKSYPLEQKRQNLLDMFGVDDFGDLVGSTIQFVRQKAGSNFYYEVA